MDFTVSNEHRALAETAATIVGRFGHQYYVEQAQSGGHATELWQELAGAGFVGANTPEKYGGMGYGIRELAIMAEEMAAGGCPSPMTIISPAIVASILRRHASEEIKQHFLPRMASGEIVVVFALTEPDAGSNSHQITTTAVQEGDIYRLNGQKYYISGADQAEAILVVARTGGDQHKGALSLFVVDAASEGLSMSPIPTALGAPERQFTVHLDNVLVPAERLVGQRDRGLTSVFSGLNPERIIVAAIACGLSRYFLDKSVAYAKQRDVWGQPIGAHQGIAHPLAWVHVKLEQARLMTQKAAWFYDQGDQDLEAGAAANIAKLAAAECAAYAFDRAVQTHGGNGLALEYGLTSLYGLTRLCRLAPISEEMGLNFVAQNLLDLPRSY
ncbi:acyl-CoA dehydrogenase family protein [Nocardioides daejeonensis]|uniref:acyl-CoA dehydrogenase family protein n=1 Tax=Nocardioides daejeonensis TaxID=1046556 RepID=UPI000D7507D3|nr:acyl-CoA dehydrogenase family protein [Nocardioides daejeonensis]